MKNRKRIFTLPPLFLPPEGGLAGNIRVDPQGSYTGVLHLIANDWHNTDWTANVNVDLSIVK